MVKTRAVIVVVVTLAVSAFSFQFVYADRFVGATYIIDASVANGNAGGTGTSASYSLTSSTGETAVGSGAAGSYKMGMGFVAQLEKSLSLTVQPSGLVAAYALDEPSGTSVSDSSVYATAGAIVGTLSSGSGKLGTSLSFNGSSQLVSIASNAQTQLNSTGTIEAWVKSSTTTGSMAAVSKSSNFWLGIASGKAAVYDWTSATTCSDTATIADGSWHHIAVTLNSGVSNGSILYVDGAPKKTCTWTPLSQTGYVAIGAVQTGASTYTEYFTGSIDHTKVFNRILTDDELLAEYSGQNAGNTSGVALGTIMPGVSNTVLSDVIIRTDAGSYTLAINQDHDLTSGSNTIAAVSGSIASPVAWSEGTTKGLGFTLAATNATAISGIWNSGSSYAAFPGSSTTFYTRTGLQSSADYLTLRLRADVASNQATTLAPYSNTITITGTITP
jgi:hypothetical protein